MLVSCFTRHHCFFLSFFFLFRDPARERPPRRRRHTVLHALPPSLPPFLSVSRAALVPCPRPSRFFFFSPERSEFLASICPRRRTRPPDLGGGLWEGTEANTRSMSAQGTREFFSATSNVPFRTEQELHEHYRSAFHRYNLKRRVAGLGPVTREWFDTHRDKLSLGRSRQGDGVDDGNQDTTVYFDPLSKKQFNTEAKYNEFVNSNKYKVSLQQRRGKLTFAWRRFAL